MITNYDMKPSTTTTTTTTTTSELGSSSGTGRRRGRHNNSYKSTKNSRQWGQQETVELISVRGQLERKFISCKRNKVVWESVSSNLRDKGFFRNPHQCKSKWKNLLNRYKNKETSDPENGKHCPFFEELHAVFSERARNLQQSTMESQQDVVQSRKRVKSNSGDQLSDDVCPDEDHGVDSNWDNLIRNSYSQKIETDREHESAGLISTNFANISNTSSSIQGMLRGFFQQQQKIELQWRESIERHQRERDLFEHEWRQSIETLERERLMMEQAWMESEEQRKIRDEIQAEKRDAVLTSLLNKLISQDNL